MSGRAASRGDTIAQPLDPSSGRSVSAPGWFSEDCYAGRFETRIVPLVGGEDTFAAVAHALHGAQKSIHMAFWGLDPGTILLRGSGETYEPRNVLANILIEKALSGVDVDLIVWDKVGSGIGSGGSGGSGIVGDANSQNLGKLYTLSQQAVLAHMRVTMTNSFSRLGVIGSFHQKFIVIDIDDPEKATAFVMGHNMMPNYWDTNAHSAYLQRRHYYLKLTGNRPILATPYDHIIAEKKNSDDLEPFMDVSTQIWGASVLDVYHSFATIAKANGLSVVPTAESLSGKSTSYDQAVTGRKSPASQVSRTYYPDGEKGVRDHYANIIKIVNRFVIMINQYLRDGDLTDEIIETLTKDDRIPAKKDVHFIVVSNDWEGEAAQKGHDTVIVQKFKSAGIDISLVKLVTQAAARRRRIYVHAKLLLVDDVFTSIGSTNYNDRSMISDPELNITGQDPPMSQELRRKMMGIIIGSSLNDLEGDAQTGFDEWLARVARNDSFYSRNPAVPLPNGTAITHTPVRWRGFPTKWAGLPPSDGEAVA